MGFKTANDTPCINAKGDHYISCIEEEAYSSDDIFPSGRTHFKVTAFHPDNTHGLVQLVKINTGAIGTSSANALTLIMNPNISYFVVMTDPKLQFISSNPEIVSRTVLKFTKNAGAVSLFLKVDV